MVARAVARQDFTPNPYDRQALRWAVIFTIITITMSITRFERGDIVEVLETRPSGLWQGRCRGRVGTFKFVMVEVTLSTLIPVTRLPSTLLTTNRLASTRLASTCLALTFTRLNLPRLHSPWP